MDQAVIKVLFMTLLISAVFIQINEASEFNIVQLDVENTTMELENETVSAFESLVSCKDYNCTVCIKFKVALTPHHVCLTSGLNPSVLGVFLMVTFNKYTIWKQQLNFNSLCVGLPSPIHFASMCLAVYDLAFKLPESARACIGTKLVLIHPLFNYNIVCINYAKGVGISVGKNTVESHSNAMVDINTINGKPKIKINKVPIGLIKRIIDLLVEQNKIFNETESNLSKQIDNDVKEDNVWNEFWPSVGFAGMDYGDI